jgi:SAM-dependent methyltransferase
MLDVGCGLGYVMQYFHQRGCEVYGVDGSPSAVADGVMEGYVHRHDYARGPWAPDRSFDLVWSSEFLEHVEERFMENYMPTFETAERLVVVTYATPGQGGHHHVNENTEDYWIERFGRIGCEIDRGLTRTARRLVPAEGMEGKQFRDKGLLFRRTILADR